MSEFEIDYAKDEFLEKEKQIIREECKKMREKYQGFIPIVLRTKGKDISLSKNKYLVSGHITVGQFMHTVRQRITNLTSSDALYLFVNNVLPSSNELMSLVYSTYKDTETEMLFMTLCKESTFG